MVEDHLEIRDLHVKLVKGEEILKGVSFTIKKGEFHAIMGLNGSGKTTLAKAIFAHPHYEIISGDIIYKGESILNLKTDERARLGLFIAFQYPMEVPGVSLANFLRTSLNVRLEEKYKDSEDDDDDDKKRIDPFEFNILLKKELKRLDMDKSFIKRHINTGFSGGEKKRSEILQMSVLKPDLAILDEVDSGLDIDALKIVAEGIVKTKEENPEMSILMITHYQRILNYIDAIDKVHVMMDGNVVKTGGRELAEKLENEGYDWIRAEIENKKETIIESV